jgi:hypothetical protein
VNFEPLSIARLGALLTDAPDVEHRRLLFTEFVEEFQQEPIDNRGRLLNGEPILTGLPQWDALLAGLAEHLALCDGREVPTWAHGPERFLNEPWCYFDLPYFRAQAEHETPEGFRRHGVLIRAIELERV